MKIIITGIWIILSIVRSDGLCTFPSDLRGDWLSADRGIMTFAANTLTNYKIKLSASVNSVDFDCDTLQDDQYYLRGTNTLTVFGTTLRPHICLEFQNLTSDKYTYYVATDIETTSKERIYVVSDSLTVTHSEVCNRQKPYESWTYIMLIRDGVAGSSLANTCPGDIQRKFDSVYMVTADGTSSCSDSILDTCTDERIMNYTYNNVCSSSLTFSAAGSWYCMYYVNSGSSTYLATWNSDTSLITDHTYRIVCHAFQWQKNTLLMTTYPGSCRLNQTSSDVMPPGVVVTLSDVSDPEYGFDLLPFYIGGIAFALLLFGCAGVCVSCRHYKNADKPNKIHTIKVKEVNKQLLAQRESTSGIFSCDSSTIGQLDFRNTSTPILQREARQIQASPPGSLNNLYASYPHSDRHNRGFNSDIYDNIHYAYIGAGGLRKAPNVQTSEDFYRNYNLYPYKEIPYHVKNNSVKKYKEPQKWKNNFPVESFSVYDHNEKSLVDNSEDVQTAEDFVRNYQQYPHKQKPPSVNQLKASKARAGRTETDYFKTKRSTKPNNIKDMSPNGKQPELKNAQPNVRPDNTQTMVIPNGIQSDNRNYSSKISSNKILDLDAPSKFSDQFNPDSFKKHKGVSNDSPSDRGRGNITNTVHYFNRRIPLHWK